MRARLRSFLSTVSFPLVLLYGIEATLMGVFFIQALRFLVGSVYARTASASLYPALNPALIDSSLPGLVDPSALTSELRFLVSMLVLPLLSLVVGRFRWLIVVAAAIVASGRYLMLADPDIAPVVAPAIVVGGGLLYTALVIRHRARILPYMFVLALGVDQYFRAVGDTLDPSWMNEYSRIQLVLSVITVVIAVLSVIGQRRTERRMREEGAVSLDQGLLPFWSGIGFGAMLFLELSLLALPNAVAARAQTDYTLFVPLLMAATLLPLIPWVRGQTRQFISLFDTGVRGWSWMLLVMLLVVVGTRFSGIFAGLALVMAQFTVSLMWWWLARPRAQREHSFTGLWLVVGMLIFALLAVFDIFTYEYAFVRDFGPELAFLNDVIPPLLRGFRGMGLGVLLLSVFLVVLPMVPTRRRIAWTGGGLELSLSALVLVAVFSIGSSFAARPPVIRGVSQPETIRIGTYNIHAGYNEFFDYNLDDIALTIQQSGANVLLLQEVEAGRMTSFGVDQTLWLARRLQQLDWGMDARFYPTNEGLQGLAVFSQIEIVSHEGHLLESIGSQTGVQRVEVRPDEGIITLYNTWLDPLLEAGGGHSTEELEASQRNQLRQIIAIISADHPDGRLGRMVLGGTFNNVPDSDLAGRMIENGFVDHFAEGVLDANATFLRTGQRARLDYLWTRNLDAIGSGVIPTRASDHRLAVIEVLLQ